MEEIIIELATQAPVIAILFLMYRREAIKHDEKAQRLEVIHDRTREQNNELVSIFRQKFEQQKSPH